ncbi:MAG: hypothetical protein RL226_2268 [Bacteroidota bacterium]
MTAIVVFANNTLADARKKRLLPQAQLHSNVRLVEALKKRSILLAQSTGFPVFVIDAHQQRGNTFAERLLNAYADTFAKGFEKVVLIGTDHTSSTELLKDNCQLFDQSSAHAAFAPDMRGGSWFMAYSKEGFAMADFNAVPWHSSAVLAALIAQVANSFVIDTPIPDLNESTDVQWVLRRWRESFFRHISKLLSGFFIYFISNANVGLIIINLHACNKHFRGPPYQIEL